eukprot:1162545_1
MSAISNKTLHPQDSMGSGVMNDTMGCGMGRGGIMRNGKMAGDMITGGGMMSGGALKNAGPPANKANGVASSQYDANGMGQPPHQTVFNVSNQTLNQIQGQNRPHIVSCLKRTSGMQRPSHHQIWTAKQVPWTILIIKRIMSFSSILWTWWMISMNRILMVACLMCIIH